jgi:hypothetical protein
MNKTVTFFTAPITAFFYPPVYQDAAKSSAGRGVLYSLYLAGLATILIMAALSGKVMPRVDAFADWAGKNVPVLIWTPAGLSMENGQTQAILAHPQYGTIAVFDMAKTRATAADMRDTYILVTAQKVFIKKGPEQIEERDITGQAARSGRQLPPRIRFTGDVITKTYQNIRGALMFLAPFFIVVFCFTFFLITNLFYSLLGLLFNLMRTEKLGYGAIFNLACFATTAVFTLTCLRALTQFRVLNWPLILNFLITLAYMFFAFKVTDKKPAQA